MRRTRKTALQQNKSARDRHDLLHCWEVGHLEQRKKMFLIMLIEGWLNEYYCVCVFLYIIIEMFHFIRTFWKKNQSGMFEIKTVLVSLFFLLVSTILCINRTHTEKKVGHYSQIKSQSPCESEYKKCCLNESELYHLVDEDFVGCICIWLYGRNHCESYMWWG